MHTPCWLRTMLTTNQHVLKWFCSRGHCAHRVINFLWCSIVEQTAPAAAALLGYSPWQQHYSPRCSSLCISRYNLACLSSSNLPLLHHQTNLPWLPPINFKVCSTKADSVCRCNGGGGEGRLPILPSHGHCPHRSRGCCSLFLPTTIVGGMMTIAITAAARGVE